MSVDVVPVAETGRLDREFAVAWYQSWIDAWNSHDPDRVKEIVTDDFILDSPTTRHTGWLVQGPQAASDYEWHGIAHAVDDVHLLLDELDAQRSARPEPTT